MGHSRALAIEHIKVKRNEVLLADVCGVCLLAGAGERVALVPTVIGLCKACERGAAPERARERERERESDRWKQEVGSEGGAKGDARQYESKSSSAEQQSSGHE